MHAADIVRNELERPRPVERHHGDHVGQLSRLHLHQVAAHPGALHLEHAQHLPPAQQRIGLRIVDRYRVNVELDPMSLANELAGSGHDGEG